jgi:hypothetical protein
MAEQEKKPRAKKRGRGLRWWAGVAMLTAAAVLVLLWVLQRLTMRSVEQRLAAIEAARAIPDEQNAALIYNQLFLTGDRPDFFARTYPSAIYGPWLAADHPQTAAWLKKHEATIAKLLEAGQMEKCRFPVTLYTPAFNNHMKLLVAMRGSAVLLIAAGNNDMAEGRIDAGLAKYLCVIQMAKHLDQQPILISFLVSLTLEALALDRIKAFILEGDISKDRLDSIKQALSKIEPDCKRHVSDIFELDGLYAKRRLGLLTRMARLFRDDERRRIDGIRQIYSRLLAERRGVRILIALRHYKDQHGHWPPSLADIKDITAPDNLVDPRNDGPFVYRLTDGSFELYSKGPNKIDERGRLNDEADDWSIWPRRNRKTRKKNASDKQTTKSDG